MPNTASDSYLATAEEVLGYAEEGLERALKTGDLLLYRNALDKAFFIDGDGRKLVH